MGVKGGIIIVTTVITACCMHSSSRRRVRQWSVDMERALNLFFAVAVLLLFCRLSLAKADGTLPITIFFRAGCRSCMIVYV